MEKSEKFLQRHEATIAILGVGATLASMLLVGWANMDQKNQRFNEQLLQQQQRADDQFTELLKQNNALLEKIGTVDTNAKVRDKDIEIAFIKEGKL